MTVRAQTVTILFTDLVSSTELLQRAGDERAQRIFKAHHRLLSEAVQAHGGHEVKWLGDGLMVAFDSARDAALCAIAMQQAARRPAAGERLQIRVGLHVGEAFKDESDYFGTSVVIARRLCDSCDDGEIRASSLVVQLLEGRDELAFDDLGKHALKGITKPVHTWRLPYQHDPLAMLAVTPFVGRDDVIAALTKKLDEARAGKGALVMLVGEPGIGKTRTAMEFADAARQSGALVLSGRCYDGEWAPPFSPFMEAIRAYAAEAPLDELREKLGTDAGVLARIVPMLRERLPDIEEPPAIPAEGERYRLLEAACDFLARLAASRALVLMLDDLHWADKGTIAMLRQVARTAPQQKLLIIGAYRDIELDRTHPLADALQTLRRETNYERLVLKGLEPADVTALLSLVAEQEVPETFAKAIGDETGGNPFFIREVVLHLVEEGRIVQEDGRWVAATALADMRIPEGVREVIGRRLSRVSEPCGRMLTVASALTAGFSWEVISALVDFGDAPLLDAIDEALAAQLIVERERGSFDFTHALIRHTLYEELSTPRRVLLHRQIGEALERLYAHDVEPHLSELAHHFYEAADHRRGVEYCRSAALSSASVAAYDEAANSIERALLLNDDTRTRCELLMLLGRMQFYTGLLLTSLDPFLQAAQIARQLGDPHLLGRAAINEGRIWPHGDARFTPVLKEAFDALAGEESALCAQVMILHAIRSQVELGREGVVQAAEDAVSVARRCGDNRATAIVLMHRFLILRRIGELDPSVDSTEAARDLLKAAEASEDAELVRAGRISCYWALMERGRIAEAQEHMRAHVSLTDASKIPADMHVTAACNASLALTQGCLDDARRLIDEAGQFEARGVWVSYPTYVTQSILLHLLRGRANEALEMIAGASDPRLLISLGGGQSSIHNIELLAVAFLGLRERAAACLARNDPPPDPEERLTYALHRAVAAPDAIALIGDRVAAERFYRRLLPWADRALTMGLYTNVGSASRQLGLLAATIDRHEDAERHFDSALAMNARMGARPWVARTQLDYARMLVKRDAAGDRERTRELLDAALATAREIGMAKVAADCEALLTSAG
jgi:class 3 adenylate cyclase/tetratricopeptide (TPR) repeat protein